MHSTAVHCTTVSLLSQASGPCVWCMPGRNYCSVWCASCRGEGKGKEGGGRQPLLGVGVEERRAARGPVRIEDYSCRMLQEPLLLQIHNIASLPCHWVYDVHWWNYNFVRFLFFMWAAVYIAILQVLSLKHLLHDIWKRTLLEVIIKVPAPNLQPMSVVRYLSPSLIFLQGHKFSF